MRFICLAILLTGISAVATAADQDIMPLRENGNWPASRNANLFHSSIRSPGAGHAGAEALLTDDSLTAYPIVATATDDGFLGWKNSCVISPELDTASTGIEAIGGFRIVSPYILRDRLQDTLSLPHTEQ